MVIIKDSLRAIRKTYKRFISIILMALLGVAIFVGINATSDNIANAVGTYFKQYDIYNLKLASTLGLTNEDLKAVQAIDGITTAVEVYEKDVLLDINENQYVVSAMEYNENLNKVKILEGAIPQKQNEVVIDQKLAQEKNIKIGDKIKLTEVLEKNENAFLENAEVVVSGVSETPLYITDERGTSKLGTGKVDYYLYLSNENINSDIYTTIYISTNKVDGLLVESEEYKKEVEALKAKIEGISEERQKARYDSLINEATTEVNDAQAKLDKEKAKAEKEIADAEQDLEDAQQEIEKAEKELQTSTKKANTEFANARKQVEQLEKQKAQLESLENPDKATIAMLSTQIKAAKEELDKNETATYKQLDKAKREIANAKAEIKDGKKELEEKKAEAQEKIADAQAELDQAKEDIKDIEYPKWYVWDRKEANTGYSVAMQYSKILGTVSKVFPVLFFAVATLMSLNSMTRMVDEERTQIGTLKAIGYSKFQIASKYILYATLATTIGNVLGVVVGFEVITYIIESLCLETYTSVPIIPIVYDWEITIIGCLLSTVCIVGGAVYASYKKLRHVPATLMRPKAPKIGKRVFLEKIPFIWKRLSFTQKVTFRNMFRYKKRFLMTIIGISGATALTLVGFGVNDSTSNIIKLQYEDIYNYQITASLEEMSKEELDKTIKDIQEKEEITGLLPVRMQSIHINHNDQTKDLQLVVTGENLEGFINLRNSEEKYTLDNSSIILTQRIANMLEINEGDSIQIEDEDGIQKEVTVGKITEHYISHYMYMLDDLYEELYGNVAENNVLFIKTAKIDNTAEQALSKQLLENYKISSINLTSDVDSVLVDFDIIVIVLILVSGILALLVLYNLSNININERIRELATLKVLGFYPKEVDSYVNKEMTLLSLIGIILGLVLGTGLTMFILELAQLELIMFPKQIQPISYVYAFAIILVFTLLVNTISHFALKKINMIESLKSVE